MTQTTRNSLGPKAPRGASVLVGTLGAVAASLLLTSVPRDEGTAFKAYKDIVGVWTICNGDTRNVFPGQVASEKECEDRLADQLMDHATPVLAASPNLSEPGRDYQRAAVVSFTYNIGVAAYKSSTAKRKFDAGQYVAGCNALLAWNRGSFKKPYGNQCVRKTNGQYSCVVKGLDLRRKREQQVCLTNLLPGYTSVNLDAREKAVK